MDSSNSEKDLNETKQLKNKDLAYNYIDESGKNSPKEKYKPEIFSGGKSFFFIIMSILLPYTAIIVELYGHPFAEIFLIHCPTYFMWFYVAYRPRQTL